MTWRIGEILIQKKLIDWNQLEQGLEEQKRTKEFIGEILMRKNAVPKMLFYRALAEQFRIKFVDLKHTRINPRAVDLLPASIARKFQVVPIELYEETLVVGLTDPLKVWPEEDVSKLARVKHIEKVLCLPESIEEALKELYPGSLN